MGRQRSRSAREVLRERELVYPGGRAVRVGGDAEREEEDKGSVHLQNVPPGLGIGMVTRMWMERQCSRSAEENPRLRSQPHQQQDAHPGFESVYPSVGMRAGAGEAVGRECSMGLGRQRSHSAGEGVHSRLYPHQRQHRHPHPHTHLLIDSIIGNVIVFIHASRCYRR